MRGLPEESPHGPWREANNGDVLSTHVLATSTAGWHACPRSKWLGRHRTDGVYLSDAGVHWIEALANGAVPDAPLDS